MIDKLLKMAVVALAAGYVWGYYIGRYRQKPTEASSVNLDTRLIRQHGVFVNGELVLPSSND